MDPIHQLSATLRERYEVDREVGAGGMATVYRARDIRHDRVVALKVLRPELGAVLGVERFLAEIKVTANLQHPNILPLFDSGEAQGLLYYVMPFVDGETLRARLDRERQLPIEESLSITRSLASALDYAHGSNVIHRDLKPENILFQAGQPVLADFGIALAVANAGGARITQTGLSLGTPQYMSPEQATGDRVIDGRTDLYSLAAVLYEMLSGEPPHTGATAQAIIARVITDKPRSVRGTRDTIPPHIDAALERGLAKLPADRFNSGRDFTNALGAGFSTASLTAPHAASQDIRVSFSISKAALTRAAKWTAVVAAIGVGAWGWLRPRPEIREPRLSFVLDVPDSLAPVSAIGQQSLVLSPDGSELVYPAVRTGNTLLRRRFDNRTVTEVPDTRPSAGGSNNPRYSRDRQWLLLESQGRLFKVPLAGGPSVPVTDSASRASWGDDRSIVLARGVALYRVSDAGGAVTLVSRPDSALGEAAYTWPFVLPGSKGVLFSITMRDKSVDESVIAVVRLSDGRVTRLGMLGTNPRYVQSGHLLFAHQDGTISAAPFDLGRMQVSGSAVTVLDGVVVKSGGAAMFSVSDNGTLAYIEGKSVGDLVVVDGRGGMRSLTTTPASFANPRISPDGTQIAVQVRDGTNSDVWVYTLATGQPLRLTRNGRSYAPVWMRDGRRIAWISTDSSRTEVRVQAADGSGSPQKLALGNSPSIFAVVPSPTRDSIAVVSGEVGGRRLYFTATEGNTPGRLLAASSRTSVLAPSFSPDGRWLAIQMEDEVFVLSIADPASRWQVSLGGGLEPAWSNDGSKLYYRSAARLIAATLAFAPRFEVVRRDTLFATTQFGTTTAGREYDVHPRTGAFIMRTTTSGGSEHIAIVTRWLDDLTERMASAMRR